MTPEQFCYWLQGFLELGGDHVKKMDERHIQIVRDHLNLVFTKVTPDRSKVVLSEQNIKDLLGTRPGVTCSHDTKIC